MGDASVNPTREGGQNHHERDEADHERDEARHEHSAVYEDSAELRERVAAAARRLAADRLVIGTAGNVSARVDETVAITPTGAALERLEPEQVAIVNLDGEQTAGQLEPSSELALHLGVYRRYHAGGVVHTHAPMATALSCAIDELPVVHYQMLMLGGPIRVARYATFGTPELAEVTVDALQDRTAALMANHGAITYGHDLEAAVENALLLEWACGVYWHAKAIGGPRTIDAEQSQAVIDAAVGRGYGTTRERHE
jgi:L-fuculose-phosphate aldolase